MPSLSVTPGTLLCGLALLFFVGWHVYRRKKLPLPPGPKGYPVIGNLFDVPTENIWLVYSTWQKTFGDMIFMTVLGKSVLILSSLQTAADLLEKRSNIYSGRISPPFGGQMVGHDRAFAASEGEVHREARKLTHRALNSVAVKQWHWQQEAEAHKTLTKLLQSPNDFVNLFHLNSASSIMRVVYGYEIGSESDPVLRHANMVLKDFSQMMLLGKWMVDVLPFLKYVPVWAPGAGFKRIANRLRVELDKFYSDPFNLVKQRMAEGTAEPCITAQLLETTEQETDEARIQNTVGTLYFGGVDTTPSALTSFVLAMTLYPEVQKKAQDELDHIVGKERLPTFVDQPSLPYMNALIKEVLRWAPVAPLGLVHRLIKEDEYNGYRIPKDTIIFANIWHMGRDVATYGLDADIFRPERFLGLDPAPRGFRTSNTHEFGSPAFGFGRRVCPGEHFAFASLFLNCSKVLATMDISPFLGADGKPVLPAVEYESGIVAHPKPFKCKITPRSSKAVELINGAA